MGSKESALSANMETHYVPWDDDGGNKVFDS